MGVAGLAEIIRVYIRQTIIAAAVFAGATWIGIDADRHMFVGGDAALLKEAGALRAAAPGAEIAAIFSGYRWSARRCA
jgi:hypothetical protein